MIDPYVLYQASLGKINKEENGYFGVDLFNQYAQAASLDKLKDMVRLLQDSTTAEVQQIKDLIFSFRKNLPLYCVRGYAAKPPDYSYYASMRAAFDDGKRMIQLAHLNSLICEADTDPTLNKLEIKAKIDDLLANDEWVEVELMETDRVANRLKSKIAGKAPSLKRPIAEMVTGGFQVYPKENSSVVLHYYRRPAEGKLAMKVDPVTLNEVYDAANSADFDWEVEMLDSLATQIANKFSVYVREKDLFQLTQPTSKE